jgi:chemotaxis protein MotC
LRIVLSGLIATAVCLVAARAASGDALPVLAPYQMVRSLQVLQERIADGDHAALPMQKKMIELIDRRLGSATAAEFADRRNVEALMIYGMSGGSPKTLEAVAARLDLTGHDKALAEGLIAYYRSDHGKAGTILAPLDPTAERPELGGFLALIKGTIRALEHPEDGLLLLDQARLLAPGSLVEEAALRRSIALATTTADTARFLRASEQYVRRFLRSPYASHFADGFINGVVALQDRLDMAGVEAIIAAMNAEQQTAIYLRIARKGAILGHAQLTAFASEKAGTADGHEGPAKPDPRAELYNALGAVASGSIDDVARRLADIDRSALSQRDIRLLDAATEVVNGVLSPPMEPSDVLNEPVSRPAVEATAAEPSSAGPPQDELAAAGPQTMVDETEAAAASGEELPDPQTTAPAQAPAAEQDMTDLALPEAEYVGATRKKLQEIDRLLEGTRK